MKEDHDILNILVIEDNEDDVTLLKLALQEVGVDYTMNLVDVRSNFLDQDYDEYDIILLDYNLIDFDGLTALKHIREKSSVPVIVLSGTIDDLLGLELIKAGADDFIQKSFIQKLPYKVQKLTHIRKQLHDIKLKSAEEEKYIFYDNIFNNINEPFFLKDQAGKYLRVNNAFCKFYERDRESIIGKYDEELNSELSSKLSRDDGIIIQSREASAYEFKTHISGQERWYEVLKTPIILDSKFCGIFGRLADISEKKYREEEFNKSKHIMLQAEEMTMSGSFEYSADLDLITCSLNMMKMLGIHSRKLSFNKLTQMVKEEDQELFETNLQTAFTTGTEYRSQHRYQVGDAEGTFELWVRPKGDKENSTVFYGTIVDISNQAEANLALINLYEKRGESITRELHDNIGQKLQGVSLYMDRMEDCDKCAEAAGKARQLLHESMDDVESIITRNSSNQVADFSLSEAILNLTDTLPESVNIETSFSFDDKDVSKNIKLQVFRVFQEAINNISKYSKANKVHVSLQRDRSILKLIISDDGVGFSQKKKKGGNGLTNIVERIKSYNGLIKIESEKGVGTKITAMLPLN